MMLSATGQDHNPPQPNGGCQLLGDLTICRPRYYAFHTFRPCPTCARLRRMVNTWEMWYGVTTYCLNCGERWEDGERSERPFRPDWRKEQIKHARDLSSHALTRREFDRASDAYIRKFVEDAR